MPPERKGAFSEAIRPLRFWSFYDQTRGELRRWGGPWIFIVVIACVCAAVFLPSSDRHPARMILVGSPAVLVGLAAIAAALARGKIGARPKLASPRLSGHRERYEFDRPWFSLGVDLDSGEEIVVPNRVGVDPHHILFVGTTGVGKTVLFKDLWRQAAQGTGPALFVQAKPKDTLLNEVAYIAHAAGRTHDLRILNPLYPALSHTMDPFFEMPMDHRIGLVKVFYPDPGSQANSAYYRDLTLDYVDRVIGALENTEHRYHLGHVFGFFEDTPGWMSWMQGHFRFRPKVRKLLDDYAEDMRDTRLRHDLTSAFRRFATRLRPVCTGKAGRIFCPESPDFTMDEVFRNNLLAYVTMDVESDKEMGEAMGLLIVGTMWRTIIRLTERQSDFKVDPPGLVILDEYPSYLSPETRSILTKMRESWVRLVIGAQEAYQFQDEARGGSRALLEDVINNTAIQIVGRQKGESAKICAGFFGYTEKVKERWRVATGAGYGGPVSTGQIAGGVRDVRATDRTVEEVKEEAVMAEDLAVVPAKEALIQVEERGPLRVRLNGLYGVPRDFVVRPEDLDHYTAAHRRDKKLLHMKGVSGCE